MEQHLKVLSILNIVLGALGVCAAVVILLVFGGLAGLTITDGGPDAAVAPALFGMIGGFTFFVVLILSAPSLVAGIGLLNFKPWAKTLMLVVSALHLFNIPFGTALGIYGLWVLTKDETAAFLKAKNPSFSGR
jgi:hypothetical protein